jgi:hypothetical protein
MSQSKKTMVRVINPAGGCGFTSLEHARRYVRRKTAAWEGEGVAIRFLDVSPRADRVLASARAACRYDDGLASLGDVEGLPVAGSAIRLFTGKRQAAGSVREDRVVVVSIRQSEIPQPTSRFVQTWGGIPLIGGKFPEREPVCA